MDAPPPPPPYAVLLREHRETPPGWTRAEAARAAGVSKSTWEQVEKGWRMERGRPERRGVPARTLARMAGAVGVTPERLREAGEDLAAAELEFLIRTGPFTKGQKRALSKLSGPE